MSLLALGGLALGSTIANYFAQKSANDTNRAIAGQANDLQYKMFQEQLGYNTSERLAAQKYNSPENQRMLFEQAGFNPYAMLGNMNPETVAQSSPAAPSMHVPEMKANTALGEGLKEGYNMYYQTRQADLQNEALGLDNETRRVELMYKHQEKILGLLDKRQELENKKVKNAFDRDQIRLIDKQIQSYEENLEIIRGQKPELIKQSQLDTKAKELENRAKELSNQYQEWQIGFAKKRGDKELSLLDAQIKQSLSQSALNGALSASAMADKALKDAEKAGVHLDNQQKIMLRGHVLKMAQLAEDEVKLKNQLTKYETGLNARDWLRAGTSILNGVGTAVGGYVVGRGANAPSYPIQNVKAVPTTPTIYY